MFSLQNLTLEEADKPDYFTQERVIGKVMYSQYRIWCMDSSAKMWSVMP